MCHVDVVFEYMVHSYIEYQNKVFNMSQDEEIEMTQDEICNAWKERVTRPTFSSNEELEKFRDDMKQRDEEHKQNKPIFLWNNLIK